MEREEAYEREKQEAQERYERYLLTGEAILQGKAVEWVESLAQGQAAARPQT